ncbi:MAG: PspC domain-containing protein [Austwickia sp.]|nr:PspC domain-containing protein [Austwickia sp.]
MSGYLARSDRNRVLGGVCGGIAERTGLKPSTVRLAFVASCLLPGPQFVIYLILWILMPSLPTTSTVPAPPAALPGTPPGVLPDRSAMPTVADVVGDSAVDRPAQHRSLG